MHPIQSKGILSDATPAHTQMGSCAGAGCVETGEPEPRPWRFTITWMDFARVKAHLVFVLQFLLPPKTYLPNCIDVFFPMKEY